MRAKAQPGVLEGRRLVPLTLAHGTALAIRVERVGAGDGAVHWRAGHGAQLRDTENSQGPSFWGLEGHSGMTDHTAVVCPSEPPRPGEGSMVRRQTEYEPVLPLEGKPPGAEGPASP